MLDFLGHYVLPFICGIVPYCGLMIWLIVVAFFFIATLLKGNIFVASACGIQFIVTKFVLFGKFSSGTRVIHESWPAFTDFDNFYKIAVMDMFGAMLLWLILAVVLPFLFGRLQVILFLIYLGVMFFGL